MAALGITGAIVILIVVSNTPAVPAQFTDCPPPFPTRTGTVEGGRCSCNLRSVGIFYSCSGLVGWPQITPSDARAAEALSVFSSSFPSARLPSYFLVSYVPNIVDFACVRCGLTAIDAYAFANVSTLKVIKLNNNPLRVLGSHSFAHLRGLSEISLRETELTSLEADSFLNLRNVGLIYLTGNPNMVVKAGAFRNAGGIDDLDLTGHGMRRLNGSVFAGLSNVRHLTLSSAAGIDQLDAGALAGLCNVSDVYVSASQLKRVLPGAFAGATGIGTVHLNQNDIRTVESGTFGVDDDVRRVGWSGNPIECDERLAWIFEEGGLGDGRRGELLKDMRCAQPTELHHKLVAELLDEYRRRGFLNRQTTVAVSGGGGDTVQPRSPAPPNPSTTASSLRLQLQRYVALMNSTKNRRSNLGVPRAVASGSSVVLGLVLATASAAVFS